MKILYGVTGEGMGHAMRSRVVLEHLLAAGHDIEIIVSGRAAQFLSKRFEGVHTIHGFHMILEENRVRMGKTLWSNVLAGVRGVPQNIAAYFSLIENFEPEVVISDFESWTYLYGKNHRLPILSIDNMQVIHRCELPNDVVENDKAAFQLTKAFIKTKLPSCDAYFITAFFRPPPRKPNTYLFPPILRPEILGAKTHAGDHVLVYQSGPNPGLEHALAAANVECRIYGMRPGVADEQRVNTLRFLPFSEAEFVRDLATCRAVIAGGGFTLMGEAVFLHKPMHVIPLTGQFEQLLNARYLSREGYGSWSANVDDVNVIPQFLERIPDFAHALAGYSQDDNREVLAAVDEFLVQAAHQPR